jgi:hypothetical protein
MKTSGKGNQEVFFKSFTFPSPVKYNETACLGHKTRLESDGSKDFPSSACILAEMETSCEGKIEEEKR